MSIDSRKLDVFLAYSERFFHLANFLPVDLREKEQPEHESVISGEQEPYVIRYINLCSEEFHLAGCGLVDDSVFCQWVGGMQCFAKNQSFQSLWESIKHQYASQPELVKFFSGTTKAERLADIFPRFRDPMSINELRVFLDYTRRFEEFASEISGSDRKLDTPKKLDRESVINYLNLCSEQFFLRFQFEAIDEHTWHHWQTQMELFLKHNDFKTAWSIMHNQFESNPPFAEFMNSLHPID